MLPGAFLRTYVRFVAHDTEVIELSKPQASASFAREFCRPWTFQHEVTVAHALFAYAESQLKSEKNEGAAGHPSGAPARRMASIMRSRCARNTALSLSPKARRRLIENFGLTARPVPTAARASSSRPKWARQAER